MSLMMTGLFLVGLPLMFTYLFMGGLLALLNSTEADRNRQQHAREIILESEQLKHTLLSSAQLMGQLYVTRSLVTERRLDDVLECIPGKVDSLARLVAGNPPQAEKLKDVRVVCDRLIVLIEESAASLEQTGGVHVLVRSTEVQLEVLSCLKVILPTLQQIVDDANRVVERSSPRVRDSGRKFKTLIIAGMGANMALAIVLTAFFYRGTIARLKILMDNTQRLLSSRELNPLIPGGDEIAMLDRTFHETVAKLKEVDQLKQDFVRMVNHDLRSPLTSVKLGLGLLEAKFAERLSQEELSIVKKCGAQIDRLVGLISELLDMERLESGQLEMNMEWTALGSILEHSAEAVQGLCQVNKIKLVIAETDADIFADPGRVIQVLVNLLSNAIKYSPEEGTVWLIVEMDSEWITFGVRDQGRGVPARMREAIFERFKQVERADAEKKGGTGLGLFICKMIVELHGGRIWVDSEEGQGSTFWFCIPAKRTR